MFGFLNSRFPLFVTIVSIFGMLTVVMLSLNPPVAQQNISWRKLAIGSIFVAICLAGIFAAFFSNRCRTASAFHSPRDTISIKGKGEPEIKLKGHHFDCGKFSDHVINIGRFSFCAACFGLSLGATLALLGTTAYFLYGIEVVQNGLGIVAVGQVGVAVGFIQFKFKGFSRFALNTVFVLGIFSTIVGVDILARNVIVDLYLELLSIFWLFTRILFSRWDHLRICQECNTLCEIRSTWEAKSGSTGQRVHRANQ